MPENYVDKVNAQNLRVGDLVLGRGDVATIPVRDVVESIEIKQKYAYIKIEDFHRVERVELNAVYHVERTRLTQEERDAQRARDALLDLDKMERRDRAQLARYRADMITALTDGKPLSGTNAASILMLTAKVRLWETCAQRSVNMLAAVHMLAQAPETDAVADAMIDAVDEAPMRIDIVRTVRDATRRNLLQTLRFTSRSTSVPANFEDDMKSQGQLDWLEEFVWSLDLMDEK